MSDPTTARPPRLRALKISLGVFAVLAVAAIISSRILTDLWWFQSVDFSVVFSTLLVTQGLLFLVFGSLMGVAFYVSTALAYRLRPKVRRANLDTAFLIKGRDALDAKSKVLGLGLAAFFALFGGLSALGQAPVFLAAWNAKSFGQRDPYYGLDASFYVFHLPWWRFVLGFFLASLVIATIGALVVHFTTGAFTVKAFSNAGNTKKTIGAHRQMSVLLGISLIVFAGYTFLGRYQLLTSSGGLFTGVKYTDHTVRMPIQLVLTGIVVVVALVCFYNAWRPKWSLPGVALTLMLVSSLLLTGPYPWIVQSFEVKPNEPDKERPYIGAHLDATRKAFGIDRVEITDYEATQEVAAGQLRADAEALPAIRLIDPAVVGRTFEQLQQVRGYYRFAATLDVDRYVIDGKPTDAVVAMRELDFAKANADVTWNNQRTVYTHGYGLVAAYGNQRQSNGEPVFFSGGIPTEGLLDEHEARIYFGERSADWVVVGSPEGAEPVELDTPTGGDDRTEARYTYRGQGGVPIGNLLKRAAFAIRFGDINLLLSSRVNEESKLLHNRVPLERVQEVAPWLTLDSDPYPSVVDGKLVWIIDAFTTTDQFPNSAAIDYNQAISDSRTRGNLLTEPGSRVNYIRNSVKAVVDAYDGTVKLYAWDEEDPILKTWSDAFPGTITPKAEIPASLLSHLRYPADLFKVQREVLGRYHTTSSDTWYQQSDIWEVPNDPVRGGQNKQKEPPYFLTIRWPGDEKPHYANTSIFVPRERENLSVYMSANADATSPDYGRLRVLKLSDKQQIPGPGQAYNAIRTDESVAERLLPFNREGSDTEAVFGNLLTLPLGGGLLYVQPIYTVTKSTSGGYPALRFVVVRFGENVGIGDTLQAALDAVFKGDAGAKTGERPPAEQAGGVQPVPAPSEPADPADPGVVSPTPPETPSSSDNPSPADPVPGSTGTGSGQVPPVPGGSSDPEVRALLNDAQSLFEQADKSLREGDLAAYQQHIRSAKAKIEQAVTAMDG
ncbi:UPF0182 family protein [Tessaracoccus sp. OH4464_COT-324]|uniref:UPF0182 family membrane protein n=1 Tax=Tessaracoccus sp. OH4464_COT-324 TaxID=2491059 RepID=UPI000F641098|nr:UPF0182 family protein [Tessaracoccus sp. OH4464_COT-324]RRD47448.1 UPF0182 family protein [Tessaracoccus sp. OH4464_COT-324]